MNQHDMKKKLDFTAIILIGVASIGFLFVEQHYSSEIECLQLESTKINSARDLAWDNLMQGRLIYSEAKNRRDSADILLLLGHVDVSKVRAVEQNKDFIGAAIHTIDAAKTVFAISEDEGIQAETTAMAIKSYEEFFPIYEKYFFKAIDGANRLGDRLSSLTNKINRLNHQHDSLWYILFACQSLGIVLGIIALKINAKPIKVKPEHDKCTKPLMIPKVSDISREKEKAV